MPVVLCMPDDSCCVGCGSDKNASLNIGLLGEAGMTRGDVVENDRNTRIFRGLRRRVTTSLRAFRCPDCGRDQVLDHNDDLWTLDESDYSDEGSFA